MLPSILLLPNTEANAYALMIWRQCFDNKIIVLQGKHGLSHYLYGLAKHKRLSYTTYALDSAQAII